MILFRASDTREQAEQRRLIEQVRLRVDFYKVSLVADLDRLVLLEMNKGGKLGEFFAKYSPAKEKVLQDWVSSEKIKYTEIALKDTDEQNIRETLSVPSNVPADELFNYAAQEYANDPTTDISALREVFFEDLPVNALSLSDYFQTWHNASGAWSGDAFRRADNAAIQNDEGPQVLAFWQAVNDLRRYGTAPRKANPFDRDDDGDDGGLTALVTKGRKLFSGASGAVKPSFV